METLQFNLHPSQLALSNFIHGAGMRTRSSFSPPVNVENSELTQKKGLCTYKIKKAAHEFMYHGAASFRHSFIHRRHVPSAVGSQPSVNFETDTCCVGEFTQEDEFLERLEGTVIESSRNTEDQSCPGDFRNELLSLAIPSIVGQAIDPFAQLAETACVGRLGAIELASAGIAVTIFNIVSKLFNIPLLSITTSFVAEDISKTSSTHSVSGDSTNQVLKKQQLPSVSTALLLAAGIGTFEALALLCGSRRFLTILGVGPESPMHIPAQKFLSVRAFGAPAAVLSLAMQGIFRGFKDTRTPLLCAGLGNISSVILLPLLVFGLRLGLFGASIATVTSQYITTALLIWSLDKKVVLLPPRIRDLQFGGYIKSGGLLLCRTLAVLSTMTLGTSMAARQGPLAMAAHQICLQVWLAVSLLSDALASSAQALIASSFARSEQQRVKNITFFVLKIGLLTGIALALILGASFGHLAGLFTKDIEVLQIVKTGIVFVSASQPINALAFIFDGLHFGISDFSYAAYSMISIGLISSALLLYAPSKFGLPGVWLGLSVFMFLRAAAGVARLQWENGPWWFLHSRTMKQVVN